MKIYTGKFCSIVNDFLMKPSGIEPTAPEMKSCPLFRSYFKSILLAKYIAITFCFAYNFFWKSLLRACSLALLIAVYGLQKGAKCLQRSVHETSSLSRPDIHWFKFLFSDSATCPWIPIITDCLPILMYTATSGQLSEYSGIKFHRNVEVSHTIKQYHSWSALREP
jgi:hypothetical protein